MCSLGTQWRVEASCTTAREKACTQRRIRRKERQKGRNARVERKWTRDGERERERERERKQEKPIRTLKEPRGCSTAFRTRRRNGLPPLYRNGKTNPLSAPSSAFRVCAYITFDPHLCNPWPASTATARDGIEHLTSRPVVSFKAAPFQVNVSRSCSSNVCHHHHVKSTLYLLFTISLWNFRQLWCNVTSFAILFVAQFLLSFISG